MSTTLKPRPATADAVTRRVKWDAMTPLPDNPINPNRIAKMEAEGGFKPGAVGTPVLAVNDAHAYRDLPEDALVILDGNHRHNLAQRSGHGDDEVIALVWRGMTFAEINQQFLDYNNYRQHRANEIFRRRVDAGEQKAGEIDAIVSESGWRVPMWAGVGKAGGLIVATQALEWVYDGAPTFRRKFALRQSTALRRTLEGIAAMYGTGPKVASGNLIRGLGLFHLVYGERIDMDLLHERMTEKIPTTRRLIQAAELQKETWNCTVPEAYARTFQRYYNGSRKSKRNLPEF